ncbi:MAG TPA: ABC transporter substrate-binding protein [Thermoleophilaceae bacterium]|nr:ABC transporter substrate-binding protein [Thermoleophilaceae bacterium]
MIRRLLPLALLAVLLAGCGEKQDRLTPSGEKRFDVLLDFFPNADHAGIYAAQGQGHFRQAGLDVNIRQPSDPANVLKQVSAGKVDLAVSYEPQLLAARDQGQRLVAVGALVQEPLTSILSLPRGGVRRPADLKGKTVGTAGIDYQTAFLRTIALEAGVDPKTIKERNVGFGLQPALLSRRVDATLGGFWNYEGVDLRLKKRRPQIIRVDRAGVPSYDELVLVANEDALERDGGRIRAFLGALARGNRDLRRDPETGIKPLLAADKGLDPRLQRASLRVTLPLFSAPKGKPYGYQDPGQWNAFVAWMRENKLLRNLQDARGAYNNELLPGAGL